MWNVATLSSCHRPRLRRCIQISLPRSMVQEIVPSLPSWFQSFKCTLRKRGVRTEETQVYPSSLGGGGNWGATLVKKTHRRLLQLLLVSLFWFHVLLPGTESWEMRLAGCHKPETEAQTFYLKTNPSISGAVKTAGGDTLNAPRDDVRIAGWLSLEAFLICWHSSDILASAAVLAGCLAAARRLIRCDERRESPPERRLFNGQIWVSAATRTPHNAHLFLFK